ncbi:L-rhamnono-gamma-lactonase [Trichoderma lentiforme]|uniref:L-rhamnono-gamma-lactonase n=1 Tax=Trichoderma lentiforme TaxID=1567552 RepID=A0A9P4X7Y0_9HYPO|nr:L-rhamnono-gamma-lactonase [Trichoderma lentiforme]
MASSQDDRLILPIIDAHIHIYPESELSNLAWCTPDHPLAGQFSVDQFKHAARSAPSLLGFIFVETDRKNDLAAITSGDDAQAEAGWDGPLKEVRWLKRVALGTPLEGEGHSPEDKALCLAIVPWAPVPCGEAIMEKYLKRVEEEAGEAWPKIKGFRYLLQDKPHGTMLEDKFIEGLKYLGKRGFVFEVAIDQHRRGRKQLEETVEMIGRAHEGVPDDEKVTFIINHLCKPDLTVYNVSSDPSFTAWRTAIFSLGKCARTYMKLSGGFAEMTPALREQDPSHIFQSTLPWLGVVLATFGPSRIIFASDWPVCAVGFDKNETEDGDGESEAWPKWREVVEKMCWMASLSDEDRAMIFGGTAKQAYGL